MENSFSALTLAELKKMKATDVPDDPRVQARFTSLYQILHNSPRGESSFEKERYHLTGLLNQDPELRECSALSVYGVLIDLAVLGLSLEQGSQPLTYLLSYPVGSPSGQSPSPERRAVLEISPYGELALRIRSGQILHADRPVVVYSGDVFRPMISEAGHKTIVYECCVPRRSKEVIGCFICLTRPDQSRDYFWMLTPEIERLKRFSAKAGKELGANPLYSSDQGQIDIGFLEAKTIKHAFKTFPKIALGQFSRLEPTETENTRFDYGLDFSPEPAFIPPPPAQFKETEAVSNQEEIPETQLKPKAVKIEEDIF
jgi:recombinational DNA repair protein RecT